MKHRPALAGFLFVLLFLSRGSFAALSAQEFNRRLERIKQIAAESGGKIEIEVIPVHSPPQPPSLPKANIAPSEDESPQINHMTHGLKKFFRGRFLSALDSFIRAEIEDKEQDSRYWQGECLVHLGKQREALKIFEDYLLDACSDKRDDALVRTAMIHYELGNRDICRRYLRRVLDLGESDFTPLAQKWLDIL
ncbi:tetratricopeptide repeat protein [candidate division KSB1 bacterium]|nr:tetratricopeptide repeat protein [candidate division KSB1 bacterium]